MGKTWKELSFGEQRRLVLKVMLFTSAGLALELSGCGSAPTAAVSSSDYEKVGNGVEDDFDRNAIVTWAKFRGVAGLPETLPTPIAIMENGAAFEDHFRQFYALLGAGQNDLPGSDLIRTDRVYVPSSSGRRLYMNSDAGVWEAVKSRSTDSAVQRMIVNRVRSLFLARGFFECLGKLVSLGEIFDFNDYISIDSSFGLALLGKDKQTGGRMMLRAFHDGVGYSLAGKTCLALGMKRPPMTSDQMKSVAVLSQAMMSYLRVSDTEIVSLTRDSDGVGLLRFFEARRAMLAGTAASSDLHWSKNIFAINEASAASRNPFTIFDYVEMMAEQMKGVSEEPKLWFPTEP